MEWEVGPLNISVQNCGEGGGANFGSINSIFKNGFSFLVKNHLRVSFKVKKNRLAPTVS